MCGNILCGRFDPTKPFFSAHGSFWSNNTSALLTNTNEADRQARTRNRCNGEGYESVALIPLRAGNQVFGLLQFNDHRSDRFTAKMIAYLERIADSLAIALSRRQAEEALQQSRDLLAATEQISKVGGWEWNVAQQTMMWTDEVFRVHGFLPAEVQPGSPEILGRSLACYDPEDRPVVEAAFRRCVEEGEPYNLEFPFTTADGLRLWIQITARPVLEGGRVVKVLGNIMDITERKRVEASLQASLAEKEVLLREVHHRVKNNLASIIGLLDLQKVKITDEAASASLKNLGDRIMSMALVHESLYRSEDMTRIDFQGYINELTSHLQHSYGVQSHIRCSVEATEMKIGLDTAIPIGLIINELVTNAMKHAFPRGEPRPGSEGCEILITMQQDEDTYTLTVEDNGVGLPPDFDWRSCSSLGLRLVRMLGEHQLGGQSRFDQAEGTRFVLRFKDRWRQHSGS
jgi:PAS domain S-box-containing protein